MRITERLEQQLAELYTLACLQRGLRMGLRSVWLGVAGSLLAWGASRASPILLGAGGTPGWLERPAAWLLAGLVFALGPLAAFLASLSPRARWTWILDRRLALQEQVSTAWEVARQGKTGRLDEALVRDVLALLPRVRRQMLARGWFLERDLVMALAALLLGAVVFTAELLPAYSQWLDGIVPHAYEPTFSFSQPAPGERLPETSSPGEGAPPVPGEPRANAGLENSPPAGEPAGEPAPGEQTGGRGAPAPGLDSSRAAEALRELGSTLSRQAGTYDLGQALEQMDLGRAADALADLSDRLEDLSPESRENMAGAMQEAAGALEEAGAAGLADDLRRAAEALQGEGQDPGEALDQVAGALDRLAGQMQDDEMAGEQPGRGGGQPSAEPLTRLQGEGEDLELPLGEDDPAQSGLLNPTPGEAAGERIAGGAQDSTSQGGDRPAQTPLLPGSFLWKWRDVVWGYFQR